MVTPTYFPVIGGSETTVRKLTTGLNKIGIQTDIMTFNMDRLWQPRWQAETEISDEGFRIFKIPGLNWFPITHSDRITMGINLVPGRFTNLLHEYDIVHFHGELSFPLFSYFSKKHKIFHLHGLRIEFFKRYFLPRLILENIAQAYICLTERMKNELIQLGIPQRKIRCLPNSVDMEFFRPSKEREENMILFVGRLHYIKGLHVLLESLSYLKRPVELVIIGPPAQDSKYQRHIMNLVSSENSKHVHKVRYLGEKNQKDVLEWYQRASIFVLPSIYEAMGIVNLEALACETPVIATKVGGIPEVVVDKKTGILVEPNSALALANAIQYLMDNPEERRKLGKEGRKWVVRNFSEETTLQKLQSIYDELFFGSLSC